jgi:TorA maturation chaperone TorD
VTFSIDAPARRNLYLLISRLFREEVDAELFRRLLAASSEAIPWIESSLSALPEGRAIEELQAEYCRLFIGPNPPCPPFASVARGEALLGGRARAVLGDLLATHGLEVDLGARIASADHIAVVFALLAELSEPTAIHDCLSRLVLPWIPDWLAALEQEARREMFRTLARVASVLIEEEQSRSSGS